MAQCSRRIEGSEVERFDRSAYGSRGSSLEKDFWVKMSYLLILRTTLTGSKRYPNAAQHHVHVAKAFLPVDIVKAISQNPTLVQRAVETFYTRDAAQLRVCSLDSTRELF